MVDLDCSVRVERVGGGRFNDQSVKLTRSGGDATISIAATLEREFTGRAPLRVRGKGNGQGKSRMCVLRLKRASSKKNFEVHFNARQVVLARCMCAAKSR